MQIAPIYFKLFKIALITSPLFGLLGSSPGFSMERFDWNRTLEMFLTLTASTFGFWLINLFLLWISEQYPLRYNQVIRLTTSSALCALLSYLVFKQIFRVATPAPSTNITPQLIALNIPPPKGPLFLFPLLQSLSINFITFILTELILLKEHKGQADQEIEQLKLANLEAKNSQLKQQLHPHFLFNSLSTLKALISKSPENAKDYLERLADLLRFSTHANNRTLILLKEELEFCANYLYMQQTRFGEALQFSIAIPETIQIQGNVPIFSLQQLAENAIKHNILTKEQPLRIDIKTDNNNEWISITNNLQKTNWVAHSGGVGLSNLSERYRLCGQPDIRINPSNNSFSVSIKIIPHASTDYRG
jgi:hypothetical protein